MPAETPGDSIETVFLSVVRSIGQSIQSDDGTVDLEVHFRSIQINSSKQTESIIEIRLATRIRKLEDAAPR